MKRITYEVIDTYNQGTAENPGIAQVISPVEVFSSEKSFSIDYAMAQKRSYNGEVVVEEVEDAETTPTQLDVLEAQTTYTAMMTDTLLEV